jgi:hypothetical protein
MSTYHPTRTIGDETICLLFSLWPSVFSSCPTGVPSGGKNLPLLGKSLVQMATPARFERAAYGLGNRCSILLSYGVVGGFNTRPWRTSTFR